MALRSPEQEVLILPMPQNVGLSSLRGSVTGLFFISDSRDCGRATQAPGGEWRGRREERAALDLPPNQQEGEEARSDGRATGRGGE